MDSLGDTAFTEGVCNLKKPVDQFRTHQTSAFVRERFFAKAHLRDTVPKSKGKFICPVYQR